MTLEAAIISRSAGAQTTGVRALCLSTDVDVELECLRQDQGERGTTLRKMSHHQSTREGGPVQQTVLERQSVAIFLMTASLIENPLLCRRANNPVKWSWDTIPWLSS